MASRSKLEFKEEISPRKKKGKEKELWKKKQSYRKKVQEKGGNVIFADEWDKIDPGLKKGLGLKGGGSVRLAKKGGGRAYGKNS